MRTCAKGVQQRDVSWRNIILNPRYISDFLKERKALGDANRPSSQDPKASTGVTGVQEVPVALGQPQQTAPAGFSTVANDKASSPIVSLSNRFIGDVFGEKLVWILFEITSLSYRLLIGAQS